jgi:hypothetical protein
VWWCGGVALLVPGGYIKLFYNLLTTQFNFVNRLLLTFLSEINKSLLKTEEEMWLGDVDGVFP